MQLLSEQRPMRCGVTEFAKLLGKSQPYVSKLKRQGRLVMDGDQIDVPATLARLQRQRQPEQVRDAAGVPDSYTDAKTRREAALAERAEIELAQLKGRLVDVQRVEEAMVTAGRRIRQHLDALPGLVDDPELRKLLKAKLHDLQHAIADALSLADDDDVA